MMAVLNITPDSFSTTVESLPTKDTLLHQAEQALQGGARILDVGGESTRPGAQAVSKEEELHRVIPVIEALHQAFPEAILSIDTRKSRVAQQAVEAGARWVNDVSGLRYDPQMLDTVGQLYQQFGIYYVLTHSVETPATMQDNPHYPQGVVPAVKAFCTTQAERLMQAGLPATHLLLDPGIGFGKTTEDNLQLLRHLDALVALGHPVLVGTSRKRFLTLGTNTPEPIEREALTAASLAEAVRHGASVVRVHCTQTQGPVIQFLNALYHPEAGTVSLTPRLL